MKKIFIIFTAIILVFTAFALFTACNKSSKSLQDDYGNTLHGTEVKQEEGVEINETNFPDAVFREWLKTSSDLNGAGSDGYFTCEEIQNIKNITVRGTSDKLISDLKGIEFFTELTNLSVPYNSLKSLDLTNNTKLTYLNCSYNKLESLNITTLGSLRSLYCEFNFLKELDLSANVALTVIYCRHNLLENLDFSNNTQLVFIETFDNMLTEIDVSMLSQLEFLHIDHNRLTVLDMSNNLNLKGGGFVVRNNHMQRLILPSIEGFTVYYDDFAEQDPITGYEKSLWYEDEDYTVQVTSDVEAKGQTLYVKRLPNSYTVNFSAEGASSVPSSIKTFYDEQFNITDDIPIKKGYKFLYWSDDKYSDVNVYLPGQSVSNLAGDRYDGEKITLYSKWQGIEYEVSFDKNSEDATGTMDNITAIYGINATLPENAFKRQGYDFAGWSLTKNGKADFNDGQIFSNLTSREGETITLYAVWTEDSYSLQKPYIESLSSCLEKLSQQNYYEEDLSLLNTLYNDAVEKINESIKDTESMKSVTEKALKDMNDVLTKEKRVRQIADKWISENYSSFGHILSYPIPSGMAGYYLQDASSALTSADVRTFSSYSTLNNRTDREDAAEKALISVKPYTDAFTEIVNAAQWITETEIITEIPRSSVLPKNQETCRILTDRYYSFTQGESKYINTSLTDGLKEVYELASSKTTGLEKLNMIYESIDTSLYPQESIEKVDFILKNSQTSLLSAESSTEIESLLTDTVSQIKETLESTTEDTPSEDEDIVQDTDDPDTDIPDAEDPAAEEDGKADDYALTTVITVICTVLAVASILSAIYVLLKRIKKYNK